MSRLRTPARARPSPSTSRAHALGGAGLAVALGLLSAGLLSACPPPKDAGAETKCERVGAQCRLDEGLLGVCTPTDDPSCEEPPCLACVSQH